MTGAQGTAAVGPELQSLLFTRRWLTVAAACLLLVVAVGSAAQFWPLLSTSERSLVALAAALIPVGAALSARTAFLWVMVAGMWCFSLAPLAAAPSSPPWMALPTALSYAMCGLLLLVPRRIGLALLVVGSVAVLATWAMRPVSLVVISLPILDGWVAMAQVVAGWCCLWWAWHRLRGEAVAADHRIARQEGNAERARALQERAALWRAAATRVHESILNTIRYVLSARTLDRQALAIALDADDPAATATDASTTPTVHDLMAAVIADDVAGPAVQVSGPVPATGLGPDVYLALRAATTELARNAVTHGRATAVVVEPRVDAAGTLVVTVTDDGAGLPSDLVPGVGLRTVLDGSLARVHGRWRLAPAAGGGVQATLAVPHVRATPDPPLRDAPLPGFDKGRLLVTATLAGQCAMGAAYYVAVARVGGGATDVAAVLGLIGVVAAVTLVAARRHVRRRTGIALVLGPALVPWLLQLGDSATCGDVAYLAPAFNIAGIVVIAIAAWSGPLPGIVGVTTWAAGGVLLTASVPAGCRDPLELAFINTCVLLPLLLTVAWVGMRAHDRTRDRARLARQRELVEQSRAEAAVDLNAGLYGAVADAVASLRDVADGAPVDPAMRHRLELADGCIRATIQVDPKVGGGFAQMARTLVDLAAAADQPVHVRALACSGDPRPCPAAVASVLRAAVTVVDPAVPRLQVFTDGLEDHLALTISTAALHRCGLAEGETRLVDDAVVEVEETADDDTPTGRFTVLVSRPIRADDGTAGRAPGELVSAGAAARTR